MKWWTKLKKKFSDADKIIAFSVDVLIIIFDVMTTPLLIPIRIGRYYIKGFFKSMCKRFLKKTYHRLYDKE